MLHLYIYYKMTTAYLPPLSWWHQWLSEGMPQLDLNVPYGKRMGINRCDIDSPNGKLQLTVPIAKPDINMTDKRLAIKDIQISEHGDWRHKHWHALQSSYYNSPFFEYYQDDFRSIYEQQHDGIADFNQALIDLCAELMGINPSAEAILKNDSTQRQFGKPYYQVFAYKHGFLSDLSIFDLLMNMGPESLLYL